VRALRRVVRFWPDPVQTLQGLCGGYSTSADAAAGPFAHLVGLGLGPPPASGLQPPYPNPGGGGLAGLDVAAARQLLAALQAAGSQARPGRVQL